MSVDTFGGRAARLFRLLARVSAVLCLLLAALLLGADAGEYPGYSVPAMRALVTGTLRLVLPGMLNLAAAGATTPGSARWLAVAATAANLSLLAWALGHAGVGAPPFFLALPVVAVLLTVASVGLAISTRRAGGGAPGQGVGAR